MPGRSSPEPRERYSRRIVHRRERPQATVGGAVEGCDGSFPTAKSRADRGVRALQTRGQPDPTRRTSASCRNGAHAWSKSFKASRRRFERSVRCLLKARGEMSKSARNSRFLTVWSAPWPSEGSSPHKSATHYTRCSGIPPRSRDVLEPLHFPVSTLREDSRKSTIRSAFLPNR